MSSDKQDEAPANNRNNPMNEKDALNLLGFKEGSKPDEKEIQKAFKKAALKHHPDKNVNNKDEATEMMQKLGNARDFLINPPPPEVQEEKQSRPEYTQSTKKAESYTKNADEKGKSFENKSGDAPKTAKEFSGGRQPRKEATPEDVENKHPKVPAKEAGMAAGMAANTVVPGSGFVVAPLVEQHLNQENAKDEAKEDSAKEDNADPTAGAPSPNPKKSGDKKGDKKGDNSTSAYGQNLMDKNEGLQKNLYSGLHKSVASLLMTPFKMMLSSFNKMMLKNPVDNAADSLSSSNQGGTKQGGGQQPGASASNNASNAPPPSPDVIGGGMTPPM